MTNSGLKLYTPGRYRIRVQGCLDQSCSDWLDGMSITTIGEADEAPVTTLVGPLLDQAALMGVLDTLYDYHHCPQLSVEYLGHVWVNVVVLAVIGLMDLLTEFLIDTARQRNGSISFIVDAAQIKASDLKPSPISLGCI